MMRLRNPLKITIVTLAIIFALAISCVSVCAAESAILISTMDKSFNIIETNNYLKIGIIAIQVAVVLGMALTIIQLLYLRKRDASAYEKALTNCQKFLESETNKSKKLQAELNISKNKEDELYEWKNNAIKADCMIQDRIDLMIARNVASSFEERYVGVEELDVLASNFNYFNSAIMAYEAMNDLQREHVTMKMDIIREKRQVSGELYAKEVERYLDEVYSTTMDDRFSKGKLSQAVSYYMNLPFYIKKIMDVNCFKRVNNAYNAAVKDYNKHQK